MRQLQVWFDNVRPTQELVAKLREIMGDQIVCHTADIPRDVKIDVFVLPGEEMLEDHPGTVGQLKKERGAAESKVIAVAESNEILLGLEKTLGLSWDLLLLKSDFVAGADDEKVGDFFK